MLGPIRMGPFALPTAGIEPHLIEVQPIADPWKDGGCDKHCGIPIPSFMHTEQVAGKNVGQSFAIAPFWEVRFEHANFRSTGHDVGDLNSITGTTCRWLKLARPDNAIATISLRAKLRIAGPHQPILLADSEPLGS